MKPSIPKGTRDFSPLEMQQRNFILDTIRNVYVKFGYQQIETPAMENIETLTGKYGDEGDQLLFKILNSRIYESKNKEKLKEEFSIALERNSNSPELTERALRYDLTVPFARYVVMHQNEITFPFKRYQIQPVWRADRPQKGRYREFIQCDADVIGSTSLLNEVELIQIIDEVFSKLNVGVAIKINNRKILSGIAEIIGEADKIIDITVAIDKLDKIGIEKVNEELRSKGLTEKAIQQIQPLMSLKGSNEEKLSSLENLLSVSQIGKKGIEETKTILDYLSLEPGTLNIEPELDITLARGLNYYTGAIIEVKVDDKRSSFTSSVLGGGRYDDLTGIFGLPNVSGVGISFGVDRIYDVMDEMKLFDQLNLQSSSTKILFVNFGTEEEKYCLQLVTKVRASGINAELYPDNAKIKKQMSYADAKKIPFVAMLGSDEMKAQKIMLKNMVSGEQEKVSLEQLIEKTK